MPLTLHYECDVCKQLQDPRGLSWERQASSININIAGAWPQTEHKWNTVCPSCALIINDAINSALTKLKPQHIKK